MTRALVVLALASLALCSSAEAQRRRRPDAGVRRHAPVAEPVAPASPLVAQPPHATVPTVAPSPVPALICCVGLPLALVVAMGVFASRSRSRRLKAERDARTLVLVRDAVADVGRGLRSVENARAIVDVAAPELRRAGVADGYSAATFEAISDNVLTADERLALRAAWDAFAPDPTDQRVVDANTAISHAAAVEEILAHRVPRLSTAPPSGLMLQTDEQLVWTTPAFGIEGSMEMRTEMSFDSVGVPIGKGMYYSVGGGRSVSRLQRGIRHAGVGHLVFTTKHITFVGVSSTVRIPFSSVVRIVAADDGFALQLDSDVRPFFVVRLARRADAWLAANLAANLPRARG